jgi:hypothetical protein
MGAEIEAPRRGASKPERAAEGDANDDELLEIAHTAWLSACR